MMPWSNLNDSLAFIQSHNQVKFKSVYFVYDLIAAKLNTLPTAVTPIKCQLLDFSILNY